MQTRCAKLIKMQHKMFTCSVDKMTDHTRRAGPTASMLQLAKLLEEGSKYRWCINMHKPLLNTQKNLHLSSGSVDPPKTRYTILPHWWLIRPRQLCNADHFLDKCVCNTWPKAQLYNIIVICLCWRNFWPTLSKSQCGREYNKQKMISEQDKPYRQLH